MQYYPNRSLIEILVITYFTENKYYKHVNLRSISGCLPYYLVAFVSSSVISKYIIYSANLQALSSFSNTTDEVQGGGGGAGREEGSRPLNYKPPLTSQHKPRSPVSHGSTPQASHNTPHTYPLRSAQTENHLHTHPAQPAPHGHCSYF